METENFVLGRKTYHTDRDGIFAGAIYTIVRLGFPEGKPKDAELLSFLKEKKYVVTDEPFYIHLPSLGQPQGAKGRVKPTDLLLDGMRQIFLPEPGSAQERAFYYRLNGENYRLQTNGLSGDSKPHDPLYVQRNLFQRIADFETAYRDGRAPNLSAPLFAFRIGHKRSDENLFYWLGYSSDPKRHKETRRLVFVKDDDSLDLKMEGFVLIDRGKEAGAMKMSADELLQHQGELSSTVPFYEMTTPILADRSMRNTFPYLYRPGPLGPHLDPNGPESKELKDMAGAAKVVEGLTRDLVAVKQESKAAPPAPPPVPPLALPPPPAASGTKKGWWLKKHRPSSPTQGGGDPRIG